MGSWGDVEWHTTPHEEFKTYYANVDDYRYVAEPVGTSISTGQWICFYSRMGGKRVCDKVYSTSVRVHHSGYPNAWDKFVAMENSNGVGGDSGGPWSWEYTAYGIHSGFKVMRFKRRDLFSRVAYLPQALGVSVRTYHL